MQDQSLDWENVYGCILTKLPAWLVVICMQMQNKKVANKNLLSTHCMYRCEHVVFQKLSLN